MKFRNIYQLFREQTARYRGEAVFYSRQKSEPPAVAGGLTPNTWSSINWEDFEEEVNDFAYALLAKGLTRGASVAILAENVPEWTIVDVATIGAGEVGVGIYPTSSTEQCEYIINHSDAEFVFVDSILQSQKIAESWECCEKLKR